MAYWQTAARTIHRKQERQRNRWHKTPKTNKSSGGTANLATPETEEKDKETEQAGTEKQTEETVEHRTGDNIVGISDKDMTEVYSTKYDSVRNDVTEKWKCLVIAENNFDITEYALSCYKNYFDSDETILAVINLTTKTNICTVVFSLHLIL